MVRRADRFLAECAEGVDEGLVGRAGVAYGNDHGYHPPPTPPPGGDRLVRHVYRILALLVAAEVVVQEMAIGYWTPAWA